MNKQLEYFIHNKFDKGLMETLWKFSPYRIAKYIINENNVVIERGWHPSQSKNTIILNYLKNIINTFNLKLNCIIYILTSDRTIIQQTKDYHEDLNNYLKMYPEHKKGYENFLQLKKKKIVSNFIELSNLHSYLPIFCFNKNIETKHICIPDIYFIKDYRKHSRFSTKQKYVESTYNYIINLNREKKFKKKKTKCIFASKDNYWSNSNYKLFIELKKKNKLLDHKSIYPDQQLNYKFLLGNICRWDTIYWQLLSNSVVIVPKKNNLTHFINTCYLKENEHYLTFDNTKNNSIDELIEKHKNDDDFLKKIAGNSTKLIKELTKEKVDKDFADLLIVYNNIYNSI